ncbi:hypothetical protein OG946_16875 [Streptomyces sp. NBC_01808]|nr:hypothetical protein [Streptomyces sp. NBC_01808]WSA38897.1 hypothetical protein OG946_16875 [Streptomyces sp. NBC_01808]
MESCPDGSYTLWLRDAAVTSRATADYGSLGVEEASTAVTRVFLGGVLAT